MEENESTGETGQQNWRALYWIVAATVGGIFGYWSLASMMRGPGDPTGHFVGAVFGAFFGLAVYGVHRMLQIRLRLSFGLKTILVLVAVVAVLFSVSGRYLSDYLDPKPRFEVRGVIERRDIDAIRHLIASAPNVNAKQLHAVRARGPGVVRVVTTQTGNGLTGELIDVEKQAGEWKVVQVEVWEE